MRRGALVRFEGSLPAAEIVRLTGDHDLFLVYSEAIARETGNWLARRRSAAGTLRRK